MPRFAANLSTLFNELPFLNRFAAARQAGFEGVEFLFPYEFALEQVAAARRHAGVDVVLFNMPPGDWAGGERGLAVFPDRRSEWRKGLKLALQYAEALGVPRLHMMAGIADSADTVARRAYLEALIEAADLFRPEGIDVLIEPLNHRDMPGYFLNDFRQAAAIVAEAARPNLRLQFDIYHRQILHGDVLRGLEELLPIIGHVQLASVPARNEPGTGELNDFAILRRLDELGYAGEVGLEYRPAAGTLDGLRWRAQVVER